MRRGRFIEDASLRRRNWVDAYCIILFTSKSVQPQHPRKGCVTVSKDEYNSAKGKRCSTNM